jgi:hypothetical protein
MRKKAFMLASGVPFRGFLVLLGSLMLSAVTWAQASGVVSGTVTDEDNRPLPGVTITLTGSDGSRHGSLVTDAKGRYEIVNLAPDTYTVTAEVPGFRAAMKTQRVTSGRREVWVVMTPGELPETLPLPAQPPARIVPLSTQWPVQSSVFATRKPR